MPEDLSSLIRSCIKHAGGGVTITQLSDVKTPYHDRMAFGIMDLDAALGGGLPRGTICQIFGPDGSGKNLLANLLMAECQTKYGDDSNILCLSFGYKPDVNFMRKCAVKVHKTAHELIELGIDPAKAKPEDLGEQVGNVFFVDIENEADPPQTKKKAKKAGKGEKEEESGGPAEALLTAAADMVASGRFHLVIIDEMASGETKDDVSKALKDNSKMATWTSLVTQFIKKIYTGLRTRDADGEPNATSIVVLQPVRANMDPNSAKFNKYIIPSGFALKHAKAIDIHIEGKGAVRHGGDKVGKIVGWKIGKGKFGLSEGAAGEFPFIFFDNAGNGGVDTLTILANTARAYEVITRRGAFHYILDYEERIEGGMDGVIEELRGRPEIVEEVRVAVLAAVLDGEVRG